MFNDGNRFHAIGSGEMGSVPRQASQAQPSDLRIFVIVPAMFQRIGQTDSECQRIKIPGLLVFNGMMRSNRVTDDGREVPSFRQSAANMGVVDPQHGAFRFGERARMEFLMMRHGSGVAGKSVCYHDAADIMDQSRDESAAFAQLHAQSH